MRILEIKAVYGDGKMLAIIDPDEVKYPVVTVNKDTEYYDFAGIDFNKKPIRGDNYSVAEGTTFVMIGCDPKLGQRDIIVQDSARATKRYVIAVGDVTPFEPWIGATEQLS